MKKYFVAGDKLLAFNAKCCTSSLVREIIRTYYPDIEQMIQGASYPDGKNAENTRHHQWVPARVNADRPVVQVVRDPVERFRSSMAELGLNDVDATLEELRTEAGDYGRGTRGNVLAANVHFLPQVRFDGDITFYKNADDAAAALGLRTPLPVINESGTKPTLTEQQASSVRAWYAEDVALWESLE